MSVVCLNGQYMPMSEAKISPMDRGFLFGDGIYEVVPSYSGRTVGFAMHLKRMRDGLRAIDIDFSLKDQAWQRIAKNLMERNGQGNLGLYFHVSRGADDSRFHAYPDDAEPTFFAFAFDIPDAPVADKNLAKNFNVVTAQDLRWKRCHIKSTSLLGNVMHFQDGQNAGSQETILYNDKRELTEASACNVFIVKDGVVSTPPLDNQILPGVTRGMLIDILSKEGVIEVQERTIKMDEVFDADEIWLTSSSKEIAPVVEIDGEPVGTGKVGDIWQHAQSQFSARKFDY